MHLSYFGIKIIYLQREGGGGGSVNLRAYQILSKLLPYINWFTQIEHPPKISIGVSLKYSIWFVIGFAVINNQIPMNRRNSLNSSAGTLIILMASKIITFLTNALGNKS